jgi:hypothetical protein
MFKHAKLYKHFQIEALGTAFTQQPSSPPDDGGKSRQKTFPKKCPSFSTAHDKWVCFDQSRDHRFDGKPLRKTSLTNDGNLAGYSIKSNSEHCECRNESD